MILKSLLFSTLFLFSNILYAATDTQVFQKIEKNLDSIIVKDLSKNKLIYTKDENKPLRPASLTKIMTSILAIESGKLNSIVTITKEMSNVEPTKTGLKPGDKVFLKDLVHAAMIKSANDAATAIAYYLGNGDKDNFVAMMNKKAKSIGMSNTTFTNPAGFDIGNHKSTARDLMKLSEYAIQNKTFNEIVKLNKYVFKTLNTDRKVTVYTSNKLQKQDKYVVGIKTGYTNQAGACLIARAKKNDKDILLVMLNSENRWETAKMALDQATKNNNKQQPTAVKTQQKNVVKANQKNTQPQKVVKNVKKEKEPKKEKKKVV